MKVPSTFDFDMYGSHYSQSMNAQEMQSWGSRIVEHIEEIFFADNAVHADKIPMLCYTGMSGIAAASTINALMSGEHCYKMCSMYVRKSDEQSHGLPVEFFVGYHSKKIDSPEDFIFIFCDDFVESGKTMGRVIQAIKDQFDYTPKFIYNALSSTERKLTQVDKDTFTLFVERANETL